LPVREGAGLPAIEERGGAVFLKVRASPGAPRDGIAGLHGDALRVRVRAPPENGRANAAIARLLAERLGLRPADVTLESGPASRDKRFRVRGLTAARAREILLALLAGTD
jgi:uncharacterized protein (TIGR00251 family)